MITLQYSLVLLTVWSVFLQRLTARGFSVPIISDGMIRLEMHPLLGGPSWLPVHVKVVVGEVNRYDFVPQNATSPETLKKLLSLQDVPADARSFLSDQCDDLYSRRANRFCQEYSKDLHLITNNCWTFAFELVQFLVDEEE